MIAQAPEFDALSSDGKQLKLADFRGKKNVVLYFYPKDGTMVCTAEACGFRDMYDELIAGDTEVIGVSTDSVHSHRAWIKTPRSQNGIEGLKFPLASDAGGRLSRQYNILVEEPNIALRGLYIINPEGVLQYAVVHAINIGRSVDETLRVLQALQSGGFCMADWKPEKKS